MGFFTLSITASGSNNAAFLATESQILHPAGYGLLALLASVSTFPMNPTAGGSSFYTWQSAYFGGNLSALFLILAVGFAFISFFPLLRRKSSDPRILPLYGLLILLAFLSLQGSSYPFREVAEALYASGSPAATLLYVTDSQFVLYPVAFILPILFFRGLVDLRAVLRNRAVSSTPMRGVGARERRRFEMGVRAGYPEWAVLGVAALVVFGLPWYAFTPEATPSLRPIGGDGPIDGTVTVPTYLTSLGSYLSENADGRVTLVLPESYNFDSLDYDGLRYVDTGAFGFISSSPAILGEAGARGLSDYLYSSIQSVLSSPITPRTNFVALLSALNIKFVVLNTAPGTFGAIEWYNVTLFEQAFDTQGNISFVGTFGPFELYENLESVNPIEVATPIVFTPTIAKPMTDSGNLLPESVILSGSQTLITSVTPGPNSSVTLAYQYQSPFPEVNWEITFPGGLTLTRYNYLLVDFEVTSPLVALAVRGQTLFSQSPAPFGDSNLRPMNPSTPGGDWLAQTSGTPLYSRLSVVQSNLRMVFRTHRVAAGVRELYKPHGHASAQFERDAGLGLRHPTSECLARRLRRSQRPCPIPYSDSPLGRSYCCGQCVVRQPTPSNERLVRVSVHFVH